MSEIIQEIKSGELDNIEKEIYDLPLDEAAKIQVTLNRTKIKWEKKIKQGNFRDTCPFWNYGCGYGLLLLLRFWRSVYYFQPLWNLRRWFLF